MVSARFRLYVGVSLFVSAAALAVAGLWLPAAGLMWPLGWLAGTWHSQYRIAVLSAALLTVGAELERSRAEAFRLHDQLMRDWDRAHAGQFAEDAPMLPDLRDRPDWVSLDRKPDTAAPHMPVSERTTTHP